MFKIGIQTDILWRKPDRVSQQLDLNYQHPFILKTILLYNCNDFIEWLDNHQKPVSNKVDKFVKDLILPRYNEIQIVMDKFQQYVKPSKTFIGSTLRMTALEQLL